MTATKTDFNALCDNIDLLAPHIRPHFLTKEVLIDARLITIGDMLKMIAAYKLDLGKEVSIEGLKREQAQLETAETSGAADIAKIRRRIATNRQCRRETEELICGHEAHAKRLAAASYDPQHVLAEAASLRAANRERSATLIELQVEMVKSRLSQLEREARLIRIDLALDAAELAFEKTCRRLSKMIEIAGRVVELFNTHIADQARKAEAAKLAEQRHQAAMAAKAVVVKTGAEPATVPASPAVDPALAAAMRFDGFNPDDPDEVAAVQDLYVAADLAVALEISVSA